MAKEFLEQRASKVFEKARELAQRLHEKDEKNSPSPQGVEFFIVGRIPAKDFGRFARAVIAHNNDLAKLMLEAYSLRRELERCYVY